MNRKSISRTESTYGYFNHICLYPFIGVEIYFWLCRNRNEPDYLPTIFNVTVTALMTSQKPCVIKILMLLCSCLDLKKILYLPN